MASILDDQQMETHSEGKTPGTYSTTNCIYMQQQQSVNPLGDREIMDHASSGDTQNLRFEFPLQSESFHRHRPAKKQPPYVYRDQDRFVPINNIGRTMRKAIPKNGKVSKDAKECMQECVSELISFLASEASDRCIDEKRKTITGDDILFSLSNLGFDNYVEPLQLYLKKYREYSRFDKGDKELAEEATNTLPTN